MPKSSIGKKKLSGKDKIRENCKRKVTGGAANRGNKKGQGTLKAGSAFKYSNASSKAGRTAPDGQKNLKGSNYRSDNTIKRLAMYKDKPNVHKMREQPNKPVRIQPDRRWFGNTRVIAQDKMQAFRETLSKGVQDSFSVVLKASKLPMSLLKETEDKASRMNLLSISPYSEAFGKKRQQKKPKLGHYDLEGLLKSAEEKADGYNGEKDTRSQVDATTGLEVTADDGTKHVSEEIFSKGTSRRIYSELWKVVDCADVIVEVLDARDPMGTRCFHLEREIRKNRPHKHIVLVLNKVDLVPTWVSRRWIQVLMKEYPTLAFHASISNPFGKNSLLNLLRQFSTLMKDKKHVTIGMIGYPNVGKSSVINTMRKKKVCKAAPVPGETRIWQYIALTRRLYCLDCPGIVPPTPKDFDSDCAKVLKGVVRAERIQTPSDYIHEVLSRVKRQYLLQKYKLPAETTWQDAEEFLEIVGRKMGKLHKGGEPQIDVAARIVLYDWQRGRIPFFTPPPGEPGAADQATAASSSSSAPNAPAIADAQGASSSSGPPEEAAGEAKAAGDAGAEADQAGESAAAGSNPSVSEAITTLASRQSLDDLRCSLLYDEDDRQGEEPPTPAEAKGKAEKKKKKRAAAAGGAEGADAGAAGGSGAKKRRKRGEGAGGQPAGGRAGRPVQTGSMDWKAVVSEFGI